MRILVFAPNWVGDVIFITPIAVAVKQAYKDSFLSFIVPQRCQDVLIGNPYVDKIIIFDERSSHRSVREKVKFVSALRKDSYDIVFLLHRSFTRTFLCYLAGIKQRVGYAYPKRAFLLTHRIPVISKDSLHKQDYYLKVVEDYGIPVENKNSRIYLSDDVVRRTEVLLEEHIKEDDFCIALSPSTNWPPKDWPLDYFERFIHLVHDEFKKVKFFITGSYHKIYFPRLEKEKFVINLSGKTTLLELAAVYRRMNVVVTGDSGPLHIAASVGTPYVGIYGATSPSLTSPRSSTKGKIIFRNTTCSVPCYIKRCERNFICMRSVKPEEVAEVVNSILRKKDD